MRLFILLSALFWSAIASAQNTRSLEPGATPPAASIDDVEWIVGHWAGEGLGGQSYETISPPVAGVISGHFQQAKDGKLLFSEFYQIVPEGNSLVFKLKHFNPDLTGWEEKDEMIAFPLVAIEEDAVYFDGLTIRKDGPDGMKSYVVIGHDDGTKEEAAFAFKRVRF